MTPNRKYLIKDLKLKGEAFKRELESFQAVLDICGEKGSIIVIRSLLYDLEEEYIAFKRTQSKLDNIDDGQTMQERIDLRKAFNRCKGRAQDIIEMIKMQISERLYLKKEKISVDDILHQELIFADLVQSVRCLSSIIHNVEKYVLSSDQDTKDNFQSKTMTESLQSMMVDISGISKMNFRQNMSTFDTVSSTTSPAAPTIDDTIT